MLSACNHDVPNPYKDNVRDIIGRLICLDNDYRLLTVTVREIQEKHQREIKLIEQNCGEWRAQICNIAKPSPPLTYKQQIEKLDELNSCFESRMEELAKKRDCILTDSKVCYKDLLNEKCQMQRFHEKTLDALRLHAIEATDPEVVRRCDNDICALQKLFLTEVSHIRTGENVLLPFFDLLRDPKDDTCNCLAKYVGEPIPKPFEAVAQLADQMKAKFGPTLKEILAQAHLHQPEDVKTFLATYLLNMERNKQISKEFQRLFGPV